MKTKTCLLSILLLCTALCVTGAWAAETASGHDSNVSSKPNPLNNLYFGEQHLHTKSSVDAFIMGNRKNTIEDAFFRYDKGPDVTFSSMESNRPEDLWTYLQTQRDMGHECFSISHNGNISNSLMYAPRDSEGALLSKRYAELRALPEHLLREWGSFSSGVL